MKKKFYLLIGLLLVAFANTYAQCDGTVGYDTYTIYRDQNGEPTGLSDPSGNQHSIYDIVPNSYICKLYGTPNSQGTLIAYKIEGPRDTLGRVIGGDGNVEDFEYCYDSSVTYDYNEVCFGGICGACSFYTPNGRYTYYLGVYQISHYFAYRIDEMPEPQNFKIFNTSKGTTFCSQSCDCGNTWYRDWDGDSYGASTIWQKLPTSAGQPAGYVLVAGDCNDRDPRVTLPINGVCPNTWYLDADFDKYYSRSVQQFQSPGFEWSPCGACMLGGGDCNDCNPTIYPGSPNGNANGIPGVNGCATCYHDWFRDEDGDGFGTLLNRINSGPVPPAPTGWVLDSTDCDDVPAPTGCGADCHPGSLSSLPAEEICDGFDNDCNGLIDDSPPAPSSPHTHGMSALSAVSECNESCCSDDDNDNYSENDGDCDDTNDEIHPGARDFSFHALGLASEDFGGFVSADCSVGSILVDFELYDCDAEAEVTVTAVRDDGLSLSQPTPESGLSLRRYRAVFTDAPTGRYTVTLFHQGSQCCSQIAEVPTCTWYYDEDEDGYWGDQQEAVEQPGSDWSLDPEEGEDCKDTDAQYNPGSTEEPEILVFANQGDNFGCNDGEIQIFINYYNCKGLSNLPTSATATRIDETEFSNLSFDLLSDDVFIGTISNVEPGFYTVDLCFADGNCQTITTDGSGNPIELIHSKCNGTVSVEVTTPPSYESCSDGAIKIDLNLNGDCATDWTYDLRRETLDNITHNSIGPVSVNGTSATRSELEGNSDISKWIITASYDGAVHCAVMQSEFYIHSSQTCNLSALLTPQINPTSTSCNSEVFINVTDAGPVCSPKTYTIYFEPLLHSYPAMNYSGIGPIELLTDIPPGIWIPEIFDDKFVCHSVLPYLTLTPCPRPTIIPNGITISNSSVNIIWSSDIANCVDGYNIQLNYTPGNSNRRNPPRNCNVSPSNLRQPISDATQTFHTFANLCPGKYTGTLTSICEPGSTNPPAATNFSFEICNGNANCPPAVYKTDEPESFEEEVLLSEDDETLRAYPNPFNDLLNIEFNLAEDSRVKLEIFNVEGKLLANLFEGDVKAGDKRIVEYRPDEISNGILFYRLQTEDKTHYQRVMMVK